MFAFLLQGLPSYGAPTSMMEPGAEQGIKRVLFSQKSENLGGLSVNGNKFLQVTICFFFVFFGCFLFVCSFETQHQFNCPDQLLNCCVLIFFKCPVSRVWVAPLLCNVLQAYLVSCFECATYSAPFSLYFHFLYLPSSHSKKLVQEIASKTTSNVVADRGLHDGRPLQEKHVLGFSERWK